MSGVLKLSLLLIKNICFREIGRALKVPGQTIIGPVLVFLLYYIGFGRSWGDGNYRIYLAPGLTIVIAFQRAFYSICSSILQDKIYGNIVFMMMAPIRKFDILIAYILAGAVQGLMVAIGFYLIMLTFSVASTDRILVLIGFVLLASAMTSAIGIAVGFWVKTFNDLEMISDFIVKPMMFLSPVFFSSDSLPTGFSLLNILNPIFYAVDGFRGYALGHSEVSVGVSLVVMMGITLVASVVALQFLSQERGVD